MTEDYQVLTISPDFRVLVTDSPHVPLCNRDLKEIEQIWQYEKKLNPHLFNGRLLNLLSYDEHHLVGTFVEYKHFLAQLRLPRLGGVLAITPVCVSAITHQGADILIGKRSSTVVQYPSCYELVPSGGVDADSIKRDGEVDVAALALRELEEEAGIGKEKIKSVRPLVLIVDNLDKNIEICMDIELIHGQRSALVPNSHEHTELKWLTKKELSVVSSKQHPGWIPLSLYLLDRYSSFRVQ